MRVWVTETRPLMDGARLASWELATLGIEHTLLPDAAVGALFERERIDAVLLGGEWVAANGDVGAISGSRVVAGMAATASGGPVPLFVVAPIATFDPLTPDGRAIPTDDRPGRDLQSHVTGTRLARTRGWNPGVDVVPRAWVGAIVTEMGVFGPSDGAAMTAALEEREARRPIQSAPADPGAADPTVPADVVDPADPAGLPTQGAA
jgi:methylthioribose-1-phosphate isomerase